MKITLFAALLASAALFNWPAHAAQSAALLQPQDRIEVLGQALQLNGSGIRTKDGQGIYNAALYLSERSSNAAAVAASAGSKRLLLTMLRDISAEELGNLFTHRIKDSTDKAALSKIVPGLLHMGQIFSQHHNLKAGESVTIDWLPGHGIQISVKGQPQGASFKDAEFSAALMKIWLGDSPADPQLKEALLGKKG